MEGGYCSNKKRAISNDPRFIDMVFSWSLEDIFNKNLYKNQVEKIPESFQSLEHYLGSYNFPLLEETRAELRSSMKIISRAPYAEVITFDQTKPYGASSYNVKVDKWRNRFSDGCREPYKTLPGDIFVLADSKPQHVLDLQRVGRAWTFALVSEIPEEDENADDSTTSTTYFKVKASTDNIKVKDGMRKLRFVIFLMNITTNKRIWNALHNMFGNLEIVKEVMCTDSAVGGNCNLCFEQNNDIWAENFTTELSSKLNESQNQAVLACLSKMRCNHKSSVELIWGPPGTGKTKTVSLLLYTLLRMKLRILTCAPTNVAIKEVASRIVNLVKDSFETDSGKDDVLFSLGDILLFGSKDRLKVNSDIEEIYLDYRIERLKECFGRLTGWRHCFSSMIDFLENCVSQYHIFLENDSKSFLEFVRDRFVTMVAPLRRCISIFSTHIPKSYILDHNFKNMISLVGLLNSFESLLFRNDVVHEQLKKIFSCPEIAEDSSHSYVNASFLLFRKRSECLSVLRALQCSLKEIGFPSVMNQGSIKEFCFQTASLIFCTASSSYKLHSIEMKPMNLLVIDEAAQLKECESTIPLQLQGIRNAILIGDECQLPATVNSNVSNEAGFGRSLFERLSSMGHSKHLLNIQYRMHPSISFFPISNFYVDQILDAPNVKSKSYEKHYLPGPMFGPYSFINIFGGREELGDVRRSLKNMVEVAVVMKIVLNLYKVWIGSKQKLSVGIISPYAAQVVAIQEKLGRKFENLDGFAVTVRSVDGFQGGEEDIIIISTVRSNTGPHKENSSNSGGSIGFISSRQRTNVALTRARHSLWILGNGRMLANSESVWQALVHDAKDRNCFFDANDNKDLAKAILEVKTQLNQLEDLLNGDSVLFKNARWQVPFSDDFMQSFKKLSSAGEKMSVINLLLNLSNGWRPKKTNVDSICERSSQILKQFKVGGLYIVCTIEIVKESRYVQVLKVWNILPLKDIPKLARRLDSMFGMYTDDYIDRCKEKCLEGNLEVPKSWVTTEDIVQYKKHNQQ